jgi:hypothetical protein
MPSRNIAPDAYTQTYLLRDERLQVAYPGQPIPLRLEAPKSPFYSVLFRSIPFYSALFARSGVFEPPSRTGAVT